MKNKGKPPYSFLSHKTRARALEPEFILYHNPAKMSIGKSHKSKEKFYPEFVQYYQLTFDTVCGILIMSRGGESSRQKTFGCNL